MATENSKLGQHEVVVTVFVVAEGVDERDAQNVARQAVTEALDTSDGQHPRQWAQLTTRTYTSKPRTAQVTGVMTIGAAFTTGALTVHPNTTTRN